MRDFLSKLFGIDLIGGSDDSNSVEIIKLEKLQIRLDHIVSQVLEQAAQNVSAEESSRLQVIIIILMSKLHVFNLRRNIWIVIRR